MSVLSRPPCTLGRDRMYSPHKTEVSEKEKKIKVNIIAMG